MRNGPNFKLATLKLLVLSSFFTTALFNSGRAQNSRPVKSAVIVDVQKTIERLIKEEDTDGDKKITIDDHFTGGKRGDKKFIVGNANNQYEVTGTYYLSNLLQELKLSEENGLKRVQLNPERIFENPVQRISRSIRQIYWDGLTRRIDEKNLASVFTDTKTATVDGFRYIYVPYGDEVAWKYFSNVSKKHPKLKIRAVRLPENVTPEWVRSRNGYHGLLNLALSRQPDGALEGVPFVVPGGRFNEMYGWDSYFEALGLLEDGRVDLAKAMVDNFVYEINYYGKILNANRSYYLTRSQPPFLTSMAMAVYENLEKNVETKAWLKEALLAAIKEYTKVWMNKDRLTETGLSRYYGSGLGPPPEVEQGHFDAIYKPYAVAHNMEIREFEKLYKAGKIKEPKLDEFFVHDRAVRESGHDTTYRWGDAGGRCADFVTVDLNSLLYKIEMDIAKTIKKQFGGSLKDNNGKIEGSEVWRQRAEKRKKLMNQYLWDAKQGLFLDYDLVRKRRRLYISATAFYPLWASLASQKQAESIVTAAVAALEMPGGIAASSKSSRGSISENRPTRQWDYPFGWAPHQMLTWRALFNYGYDDIAHRLIYRWLYTITKNAADYNGTIPEKFDVVNRSHRVFAEYGNVGTKFAYITKEGFGWMNASYQVGLKLLPTHLRSKLEQLISPEELFKL